MRVLVTGGTGFLGRAVAHQLREAGHAVTTTSRTPVDDSMIAMDLGDAASVSRAVEGHDAVIHVAAKTGVWGDAAEFHRINVVGTQHVVDACVRHGVVKLVYTSSPSVVFDGSDHARALNDLPYPAQFACAYAETKAAAERMVLDAHSRSLATVALRPHLIYGPGDPHLLPRVVERARRKQLAIVGNGLNEVSITYVDNAAAAHVSALKHLEPDAPCSGRAYFISDEEPVALWPWLNRMLARVGLPGSSGHVPLWCARSAGAVIESAWRTLGLDGEPPMTRFTAEQLGTTHSYDMGPAKRDLGYAPPVPPDVAFERTAVWLSTRAGPHHDAAALPLTVATREDGA